MGKVNRKKKLKGAVFNSVGSYFNKFYQEGLKFELTGAQKRVIKEIRSNMGSGLHMNRLLQGDVGSGKTIVGFMSMLLAKGQWISSMYDGSYRDSGTTAFCRNR